VYLGNAKLFVVSYLLISWERGDSTEKYNDKLLQQISEILDDKVGFIGPFLLKQQLTLMTANGRDLAPNEYLQLSKLVKAAVEGLFGKPSAENIFTEIKHVIPHIEIDTDNYPTLTN
jgi:hypothetical protein